MEGLSGLLIAICQMKVIPGRPDLNSEYMIDEIFAAIEKKVDIIIFPEMCVAGYLIGDLWEDNSFVRDVQIHNERIRMATAGGITAIFGSVTIDAGKKGKDGRFRISNSGLVAQDGKWVGLTIKSLQPNYRIFDDDRHFYSMCDVRDEEAEQSRLSEDPAGVECLGIHDYLQPFVLETRNGKILAGVVLCEDMWHEDYPYNPTQSLVENGAQVIFNLSASPWTWQKSRKRHLVVKDLISVCQVPLVYVNNTGIQNTGKNIVIFDGGSAVYNESGDIAYETEPYGSGTYIVELQSSMQSKQPRCLDDTSELYLALRCAVGEYFGTLPPPMRKIVIGLSGGIDSALAATFYADILGADSVITVNMPSKFNSETTKSLAAKIAENLGVRYEICPIQKIVDAIAETAGVSEDSPAYESIQAKVRMEILAARAQSVGGVFSSNCNKVEIAFGYGTLYGDMAGFMAIFGDLIKNEIYQLADHMNRNVFQREVIPWECFEISPTAELKMDQKDPFDYGNVNRRGYHDEMIRSFTEFRRNPEWFLERYAKGELEAKLKLEFGTISRLFPDPRDFIKDLEKNWTSFFNSCFKRIQSAPIPIVSKRAFGTDLRESMVSAHFTERYLDIKKLILARAPRKERVVLYGGSFSPAHKAHKRIVRELAKHFDRVFVVPCGARRDKVSMNTISAEYQIEMVKTAFQDMPSNVELDLHDLENDIFTPTHLLQKRYEKKFPNMQIWHAVGEDLIAGGGNQNAEIQRVWDEGLRIWQELNFLVIVRPGYGSRTLDLPLSAETMEIEEIICSGALIRKRAKEGKPIDDLVDPEVLEVIKKYKII